jgi:hypothetical protein
LTVSLKNNPAAARFDSNELQRKKDATLATDEPRGRVAI